MPTSERSLASPVLRFRDDLMVPRREAGGRKVHLDLIAGRQVGVEHGPHRRKKAWHDDIVFARSGADANVATDAQNTPEFPRYRMRRSLVPASQRSTSPGSP